MDARRSPATQPFYRTPRRQTPEGRRAGVSLRTDSIEGPEVCQLTAAAESVPALRSHVWRIQAFEPLLQTVGSHAAGQFADHHAVRFGAATWPNSLHRFARNPLVDN